MAIPRKVIQAVAAKTVEPEVQSLAKKLKGAKSPGPGKSTLPLNPEPPHVRVQRLYELISTDVAERGQRLLEVMDRLRRDLPQVLDKLPLKLKHLGFQGLDGLVKYMGGALQTMETDATSRAEFARGLKGWRWNFVGRVLFERLVKYHPKLDEFFRSAAKAFLGVLNEAIPATSAAKERKRFPTTLVDAFGKVREVKSRFGPRSLRKVLEFRLVGADGVERAYTDFGFIAKNSEGVWAAMPIEIKMPTALSGVAKQFSEFVPRLAEATKVIAVVEGESEPIEIAPSNLLLMQHDKAQIAVAPLSEKGFRDLLGGSASPGTARAVPAGEVGSVVSLDQGVSPTHSTIYYRLRVLVQREWLEAIVRVLTDPP